MKTLLFLAILFCSFGAYSQANSGTIAGTVTTIDHTALQNATIKLKNSGKETKSDTRGNFLLKDIPVGDHILIIKLLGYSSQQVAIKIERNVLETPITIKLSQNAKELAEVLINGGRNKFLNKKTDFVARMPLENLENPQVYSVVTKEILNEQMVVNYQEALRNAPGVITAVYPAGGFAVNLRVLFLELITAMVWPPLQIRNL